MVVGVLLIGFASGFLSGSLFSISTTTIRETETIVRSITVPSEREESLTITITLTVTETLNKTKEVAIDSCVVFKTSKETYRTSEDVILILENKCEFTLVLPNPAPWLIINESGEIIFSPITIQVIESVEPGLTLTWKWDQRDNEGRTAPPGTYYARLNTLNAGSFLASFEIIK